MKTTILHLFFSLTLISVSFAQSKSYQLLREKFAGTENVISLRTSGFMARTILWMAGENEFNDAIRNVRNVRLTVVPKAAFRKHDVTVKGFIKLAQKEGFEELISARDHGDDVIILKQDLTAKKRDDRYLILVDEGHEVVVMEVTGYVDTDELLKHKNRI